jgi:hypothetical protein
MGEDDNCRGGLRQVIQADALKFWMNRTRMTRIKWIFTDLFSDIIHNKLTSLLFEVG